MRPLTAKQKNGEGTRCAHIQVPSTDSSGVNQDSIHLQTIFNIKIYCLPTPLGRYATKPTQTTRLGWINPRLNHGLLFKRLNSEIPRDGIITILDKLLQRLIIHLGTISHLSPV